MSKEQPARFSHKVCFGEKSLKTLLSICWRQEGGLEVEKPESVSGAIDNKEEKLGSKLTEQRPLLYSLIRESEPPPPLCSRSFLLSPSAQCLVVNRSLQVSTKHLCWVYSGNLINLYLSQFLSSWYFINTPLHVSFP